jgi:hypothetical protein
MSDSTPTEPLGIPTEPLATRAETAPMPLPAEATSRKHLYILLGIGGALLVAVLVLLIAFFVRGDDTITPTVSPSLSGPATPSATPTESITPTPQTTVTQAPPPPAPAPEGPTFATFSAPTSAGCGPDDTQKPLTFSWSSTNAERAWVGVQTDNAKDSPYSGKLPPVYSYSDINYNCDQDSQYYTVTLEDGDGELAHQTVTITK